MRTQTLVEKLFADLIAGKSLPSVAGGASDDPLPPDLGKLVADAIAKHGDQTSAMKALVSDLIAAREDNGKLQSRLPKDGSVVLAADDAKDWTEYRQIGKPADVRKTVGEHKTLSDKTTAYERAEGLRQVASKAKVEFDVLSTLAGPGLVFGEARVKDKAGKDVDIVTVKDGDAQPVPFDDYAASKWAKFLPALKPSTTTTTKANPTPNRQDPTHRPAPATMRPMMPRPEGSRFVASDPPAEGAPPTALQRHQAIVKGAF